MSKSEDKKEDEEFERVVQNMLKTPPKPHKPTKSVDKKGDQESPDRLSRGRRS